MLPSIALVTCNAISKGWDGVASVPPQGKTRNINRTANDQTKVLIVPCHAKQADSPTLLEKVKTENMTAPQHHNSLGKSRRTRLPRLKDSSHLHTP